MKNRISFWKGIYTCAAFLGLILLYLAVFLYRRTLINIWFLVISVVVVGSIAFICNKNHYKRIYNVTGIKGNFFALMENIFSWGFISCYLFLSINYYLADNVKNGYTLKIKSKSSLPGRRITSSRLPTITFEYSNFVKELPIYTSQSPEVNKANKIEVIVRKGALGFDIIDNYVLIMK